eukprot:3936464-Rhodomonas_salina.1
MRGTAGVAFATSCGVCVLGAERWRARACGVGGQALAPDEPRGHARRHRARLSQGRRWSLPSLSHPLTMRARVMVCVWKGLMVVVCERGDIVTACVGEDVIVSLRGAAAPPDAEGHPPRRRSVLSLMLPRPPLELARVASCVGMRAVAVAQLCWLPPCP